MQQCRFLREAWRFELPIVLLQKRQGSGGLSLVQRLARRIYKGDFGSERVT